MKSKNLILMIVSLGFGLIAAVGISQVMGKGGSVEAVKTKMGDVVVSADHLVHNAILTEENVVIEQWPAEIIPENAASSLEQLDGMAITTRLSKGLPILMTDIVNKATIGRLAIPKGQKVVAIKVAAADTIDGLLQPGDKVDVIGVFKVKKNDTMVSTSKTFLKNITVFSVNDTTRRESGPREPGGSKSSSIVGVLVKERQAEQIVLVQKEAQLKLVLRGDEDPNDPSADDEDTTLADWFNENAVGGEEPEAEDTHGDFRTRIWSGNSVQVFSYDSAQGDLPTSMGPATGDSEDNYDYEQSEDSDSDLEQDQYPGE